MKDYKLINSKIYHPQNSVGSNTTSRSYLRNFYCKSSNTCDLYKNNTCILLNYIDNICPNGKINRLQGTTTRSKIFHSILESWNDKYQHTLNKLKSTPKKMSIIGNYIYMPYEHWNRNKELILDSYENGVLNGSSYISLDNFDIHVFESIVNYIPKYPYGGIIHEYQKDIVSKIVQHFKEVFPDMYVEWKSTYKSTEQKFEYTNNNYIGRIAQLNTITTNVKFQQDNYEMFFDGINLICENFNIGYNYKHSKTNIAKISWNITDDDLVIITNNDMVNDQTIFIN